ncbi:hypothetical protein CVT24_004228 [Panaeolus cyanescens]|uniref:F-box domain-containing protein n=1 Tax=Panaeolus cyanescens TaxID=181874 RepID=A0A409YSU3_9AGAR|nr:hypothetical protein CVT24_004228 [Panaeolus cyanescens]
MHLDSLAPELILQIAGHLSRRHWQRLRLTCKVLSETLAALVVNKISINADRKNVTELLDSIMGRSVLTPPIYAIKALDITSLRETVIPPSDSDDKSHPYYDPKRPERDEAFMKELLPVLLRLTHVQKIRWEIHSNEAESSLDQVGKIVSSYPLLESLKLVVFDYGSIPSLRLFRNLLDLDYGGYDILAPTSPIDDLCHVIVQSPKLRKLSFDSKWYRELDDLLQPCSAAGMQLPLDTIVVESCNSPLSLLPHVHHLKILDLTSSGKYDRYNASRHPDLEKFWLGMLQTDTAITQLGVDHVPPSLIQYLKSYSGLETFRFIASHGSPTDVSRNMASDFYNEALANHRATLKKLTIRFDYAEEWCWTPEIQTALSKCTVLRRVKFGVTRAQIEESVPPVLNSEEDNTVETPAETEPLPLHVIIHRIAKECPSIRTLELRSTLAELLPDRFESYTLQNELWDAFEKSLTAYESEEGVKALPFIYGGPGGSSYEYFFSPVLDKEMKKLKYQKRRRY